MTVSPSTALFQHSWVKSDVSQAPLKTLIAIHYSLLLNDNNVGVTILSHYTGREGV